MAYAATSVAGIFFMKQGGDVTAVVLRRSAHHARTSIANFLCCCAMTDHRDMAPTSQAIFLHSFTITGRNPPGW